MKGRLVAIGALVAIIAIVVLVIQLRRRDDERAPATAASGSAAPAPLAQRQARPDEPRLIDAQLGDAPSLPTPVIVAASNPSAFGGGAGIAGRVVYPGEGPATEYNLLITKFLDGHYMDQPIVITDPNGDFRFDKVVAGMWNVVISGPDIARHVVTDVSLTDGTVTNLGVIEVHRGIKISGRVLDGASRPIANAEVYLEDGGMHFQIEGEPPPPRTGPHTRSDRAGRYTLRGLKAGQHGWVEASRGDEAHALRRPIPDADAVYDFVFDPKGGIDGTVEDMDRNVGDVRVTGPIEHPANERPDGQGHFTAEGLDPGDYVLTMHRRAPVHVTVPLNGRVTATIPKAQLLVRLDITGCKGMMFLLPPDARPTWHGLDIARQIGFGSCTGGIRDVVPGAYQLCSQSPPACMQIEVTTASDHQTVDAKLQPLTLPKP